MGFSEVEDFFSERLESFEALLDVDELELEDDEGELMHFRIGDG